MSNPENIDGNVNETSLENTETNLEYNKGYKEGYDQGFAAGKQMAPTCCINKYPYKGHYEFHTNLSDASINDLYCGDMWTDTWHGMSYSSGIGYPLRDGSFYKPKFKDDRISSYYNGVAIGSKSGENTSQIAIGLHSSSFVSNGNNAVAIGSKVENYYMPNCYSINLGKCKGHSIGTSTGRKIWHCDQII
jgi:hypothetical protein